MNSFLIKYLSIVLKMKTKYSESLIPSQPVKNKNIRIDSMYDLYTN